MLLRFLGRICGDGVGSAARRLHRDVGDEMREFSRAFFQHRRFVQFRAERDFYAGVYSEAVCSARRLRKNAEDEAGKFCRGFWGQRKKVLEIYFALQGVNYVLKFPDSEPTELKEFAAEETLKEDAMKWRFEQYLMTEHGCNYKTKERMKRRGSLTCSRSAPWTLRSVTQRVVGLHLGRTCSGWRPS
uniref:Uncharacterized protein n=1 Tax=Avena sativa TaxID=4498 RepID=A0ACD5WFC4_AVESA